MKSRGASPRPCAVADAPQVEQKWNHRAVGGERTERLARLVRRRQGHRGSNAKSTKRVAAAGKAVEWHFAEKPVADFFRNFAREDGLTNIVVKFTPAMFR